VPEKISEEFASASANRAVDRMFLPTLSMAVFFVGATEFMLSSMLSPLAQAFHSSPSKAAWLISSYAFSYALASPILGYVSDRMDRKKLLIIALALFSIDTLAIVLAPTLGMAMLFRVFGGIASAIIIPTTFAIIAEVVPARHQSGAMGKVMLGMTLGIALGPALAGALSDIKGWRAPFVSVSVGCWLVSWMARRRLPAKITQTQADSQGWAWLTQWQIVRPLLAKGAWNGTGVAGFLLSGEVLRRHYDFSPSQVGFAMAVFGVGLGAGNLSAGLWRRYFNRNENLLVCVLLMLALAMSSYMLLPLPLPGALLCLGLWGAALGLGAPVSTVVLANRAGSNKGMVLSFAETFNNITILASIPVTAKLLELAGSAAAMSVLAIGLAIGGSLTVLDSLLSKPRPA
jgi:predicted MFS family arabinose efflux permease